MSLVKYRVKEVAADFGMQPKQVAEIIGIYFDKPKSNTQVLTDEQLNVVFDHITQHHQIESIAEVFAVEPAPKKEAPKKEEKPEKAKPEDKKAAAAKAYTCDVFISSANAITNDGILVNIDGNSNRVSAIAFGPEKVIFIVGMNKVASDVDGAIKRARNEAAPINAQRFGLDTPCAKTGACMNCKSADTICCQFLITRYSKHKDRIHVILVNDELGF